ncbi:hypothetical protein [Nocardioides sp. PD653]|uniref:hypothetical protein n=1 Tax=Nocardioides sp. PD653 TaxID=393303 RepID=UPI0009F14E6F|nr:hypothetical protein [Nocardioides sp. PD653]GAW54789.1 uncharacterized protein PD653_2203 [Nocardioides sp. PD653]
MTTTEPTHPSQYATRAAKVSGGGNAAPNGGAMMPLVGLMVRPFPEPGPTVRTTMEQLQHYTVEPPADEEALHELAQMPRPWDPATCTGLLRSEVWAWLDLVAMWVNEEHLWNVTRPGIPECWPAHPHLVHDLAILACCRYYTSFAVTPAALEDWHRYVLPAFLERLRDRLGDACQPGKHQPRPRLERDTAHAATPVRRGRRQRYRDDVARAGEPPAPETPSTASTPERAKRDGVEHEGWS